MFYFKNSYQTRFFWKIMLEHVNTRQRNVSFQVWLNSAQCVIVIEVVPSSRTVVSVQPSPLPMNWDMCRYWFNLRWPFSSFYLSSNCSWLGCHFGLSLDLFAAHFQLNSLLLLPTEASENHSLCLFLFSPPLYMHLSAPGSTTVILYWSVFLSPLQTVLNAAACLILHIPHYFHISSYIKDHLHWLPISTRIEYKVLLIVLKAQMGSGVNLVWNLGDRGPESKSFDFLEKFPKNLDSFRQIHQKKIDFSGQISENFGFSSNFTKNFNFSS